MFIIFERQRQRQSVSGGRAEREGDTESEAGFRLRAVSTEPDTGLKLTNHETMTWAEIKNWMRNWLSHPEAPRNTYRAPGKWEFGCRAQRMLGGKNLRNTNSPARKVGGEWENETVGSRIRATQGTLPGGDGGCFLPKAVWLGVQRWGGGWWSESWPLESKIFDIWIKTMISL